MTLDTKSGATRRSSMGVWACFLVVAGCGSDNAADGSSFGSGGSSTGSAGAVSTGGGPLLGNAGTNGLINSGTDGGGGGCQSMSQCETGKICEAASRACVAGGSCAMHKDCGLGAFCNNGACAPSVTGSPCTDATNCTSDEMCTGGFCGCVGDKYGAEKVPPNVLIVLDRSDSMNAAITGGSKWTVAQSAIASLLTAQGANINFGFAAYPGTDQKCTMGAACTAGAVVVDPGPATATPINTYLGAAATCHYGTPTGEMLTMLTTYKGLADTMRPNYILLITDGQSTCNDPVPVVTTLAGQTPPVKTFAVGFGSEVDPAQLDKIAMQGGTAVMGGAHSYYQADDAASLGKALTAIAGSVLSCTYTLSKDPADLTKLFVYFDTAAILRDTTKMVGWDYDATSKQLTFYGTDCASLQNGKVKDLVIVYGCPQPPSDVH